PAGDSPEGVVNTLVAVAGGDSEQAVCNARAVITGQAQAPSSSSEDPSAGRQATETTTTPRAVDDDNDGWTNDDGSEVEILTQREIEDLAHRENLPRQAPTREALISEEDPQPDPQPYDPQNSPRIPGQHAPN